MKLRIVLVACLVAGSFSTLARADDAPAADEVPKTLYALGLAIAQSLDVFQLSEAELQNVVNGLTDGVLKRPTKGIALDAFKAKIRDLAKARAAGVKDREKKEGEAVLAKAAAETGAAKLPSGVVYVEVKAGSGENPKASDKVKVHYHGTLRDGTVFDSSVQRGEPVEVYLQAPSKEDPRGAIPGMVEGLLKSSVGSKLKLYIPPHLAYGDDGAQGIPPAATLIFEVEVLDVKDASKLPEPAAPAAK